MSPVRLINLPTAPGEPATYRIVDHGGVAERGRLDGGADRFAELPTVLVAPGAEVMCRWLTLPAGRDAQAAAAAAFLLEDQLAVPREQLHVAVGPLEADGTRLAALVDRGRLRAWLDEAAALGISPEAVCPDCLLLPEPEGDETLAVRHDASVSVRGPGLALSCEAELLPLVMGERPYRLVEAPAEAERQLAAGAARPPVNLLQGAFGRRGTGEDGRPFVRVAVLAGLLLAALVALPTVQATRHELATGRALARVEALAGAPAPATPAEGLARLRGRVARLRAAEAFPGMAAALFAAIEGVDGMQLQTLVYGEEGRLRATVGHTNYSDVELLRAALRRAGLALRETSAVVDQGRVVSDLSVSRQP